MQNLSYLCLGELFHGERGFGIHKKKFHVRVYPFTNFELRNQEKCCDIVQELFNNSNRPGVDAVNQTNKKKIHSKKTKKEKKPSSYGHLGKALHEKNFSKKRLNFHS
jgi:hypothetical protein